MGEGTHGRNQYDGREGHGSAFLQFSTAISMISKSIFLTQDDDFQLSTAISKSRSRFPNADGDFQASMAISL